VRGGKRHKTFRFNGKQDSTKQEGESNTKKQKAKVQVNLSSECWVEKGRGKLQRKGEKVKPRHLSFLQNGGGKYGTSPKK